MFLERSIKKLFCRWGGASKLFEIGKLSYATFEKKLLKNGVNSAEPTADNMNK